MRYILLLISFWPTILLAQNIDFTLTSTTTPTLKNFYIDKIVDDRIFNQNIGTIKEGKLIVKEGLEKALLQHLEKSSTSLKALPITMHISKFKITEKTIRTIRQFNIDMTIAYYSGNSKLIEYSGSAFKQSKGEYVQTINRLIHDNIHSNLTGFDNWLSKNKQRISSNPIVNVSVKQATRSQNKNHIIFNKGRKLYITDFKGKPDEASYGSAATYSGIGMTYTTSSLYNKTNIDVTVLVYFDKTRSWMKDVGKNSTTLMHEQIHFDITAIKACELVNRIKSAQLTLENHKAELKKLLQTVQQEGDEMQKTYDKETEHGIIIDEQQRWIKKVKQQLDKQSCY